MNRRIADIGRHIGMQLEAWGGAILRWPEDKAEDRGLLRLPNAFGWRNLMPMPIAIGAALGSYSHLVLDGLMHADMAPFAWTHRSA